MRNNKVCRPVQTNFIYEINDNDSSKSLKTGFAKVLVNFQYFIWVKGMEFISKINKKQ